MSPKKLFKFSKSSSSSIEKQQKMAIYRAYRQSATFLTRSYNTIRLTSLLTGGATALSILTYVIIGFLMDSSRFAMIIPLVFLSACFFSIYFYVKPHNPTRLKIGAYFLLLVCVLAISLFQYLTGAINSNLICFAVVVILAALVGLTPVEIIIYTIINSAVGVGFILAEKVFHLYQPLFSSEQSPTTQLFTLPLLMAVIAITLIILVKTLYEALGNAELRAQEFQETNQLLSRRTQFGSQVSTSLSSIVTELNTTSRMQANGAQEQAAAVMQVTSSLTELGETARHIAANSSRVSIAANDGLYSANRVREATQRASKTSGRGQTAVESSIHSIEDVRNGITALAERLMVLTERSRQISSIIALIKEIADETHLLALNAAIESAGAGESGRRFNVVASEVKSLADRSLEATSEVSHIINELQGAVAAAVLASEETRKKTFGAVERSYQAGQVITELGQVVDETAISSIQIVEAVQQVATLAEEISLATQQQESASRQIIATMEAVGLVAQENASAVTQVSETVSRIDTLSNQLQEAFVNLNLKPGLA